MILDIILITLVLIGAAVAAGGALVLLVLGVLFRAIAAVARKAWGFFKARK